MTILGKSPLALLAVTALCALSACSAAAQSGQLSVIEDSARILNPDPAMRAASLDEMASLDADLVRIPLQWRLIAPNPTSRTKPKVDLTNPDNYPAGAWNMIDEAVAGAELRGIKPWFVLTAPAPRWAEAKESAPAPGAYQPDPELYAQFAEAAAKRYRLVKYWSIWNEPNLSLFLQPQFKNGVALSAVHYRKMYQAAYAALTANGHTRSTILFGEILPRAPIPRRINGTVPPVMWLREFFCLDEMNEPFAGAEAKKHGCNGFKQIKASGMAYHPYTTPAGPLWDDPLELNATIHHMPRIYAVLDAAAREGRLSKRKLPVFNSEFGFQSNPPDRKMVPIKNIPFYLNASEFMSFNDRRMATYSQYLLVDDVATAAFQSGLRFKNMKQKPGVYGAYQLPLVVTKRTANSVLVWGKLRAAPGASRKVKIEYKLDGEYTTLATLTANRRTGYFKKVVTNVSMANTRDFRAVSGDLTSRVTKPVETPMMQP